MAKSKFLERLDINNIFSFLGDQAFDFFDIESEINTNDFNSSMIRISKVYDDIASDVQTDRLDKQKDSIVGSQVAAFTASGVKLSGSPMEVILNTIQSFEKEIIFTEINAQIAKNQKEQRATILDIQSEMGKTKQMSTFLTGIISNADSFLKPLTKKEG